MYIEVFEVHSINVYIEEVEYHSDTSEYNATIALDCNLCSLKKWE